MGERIRAFDWSETTLGPADTWPQAPVAVAIFKGPSFIIESANAKVLEYWGRSLEQVIDKPLFEALPEAAGQGFEELLTAVLTTGKRFVAQELSVDLVRNKKLEKTYINFVYEPYRDSKGSISGIVVVANEITEQVLSRKKTEESEARFRSLIEESPVATCLFTGRDMVIEVANETIIQIWGKGDSVLGKPLREALPELEGQPFLQILDDVFTSGKPYEAKNAAATLVMDGVLDMYYFDFTYTPLFNAMGEVYGVMDTAVDVTQQVLARKKIEEAEAQTPNTAERLQLALDAGKLGSYELILYDVQTLSCAHRRHGHRSVHDQENGRQRWGSHRGGKPGKHRHYLSGLFPALNFCSGA